MSKSIQVYTVFLMSFFSVIMFNHAGYIYESTTDGHWLPIITIWFFGGALLLFYLHGMNKWKGMDVSEILVSRLGKWVSRIVFLPFLIWSLLTLITIVSHYSDVLATVFLEKTPKAALIFLLLIPMISIRYRLHDVFSVGWLFLLICLPITIFTYMTSFQNVNWHYAFPLFPSDAFWQKGAFYTSLFLLDPLFIIGFLPLLGIQHIPNISKGLKYIYILVLPVTLLAVYIPLLQFGSEAVVLLRLPNNVSMETINLEWFLFDRITFFSISAAVGYTMFFILIIIATTTATFRKVYFPISESKLVIGMVFITFTTGVFIPNWEWTLQLNEWNLPFRFYTLLILPLLVFLIPRKKVSP